ncbi:phosphate acetyltransferase [Gryllotalpicola sp.]|uniref:phosphate acetyltransferase n=1 Tax=Gryllotalpicola sp. TaxID=1932787 RepID=UPI002633C98C|nr:phosphate acetyltransferase [Gryllotalpicola sp.]
MSVKSIYVASAEGSTGKSTVAFGVLRALTRQVQRVGVFRPIARSSDGQDYVVQLLIENQTAGLTYDEVIGITYDDVQGDPDVALGRIIERYKAVEAKCDAVVVVGSDYTGVSAPTELGFNARIAANLGAPVLLVLGGRVAGIAGDEVMGARPPRSPAQVKQLAESTIAELHAEHAALLGVVVNRADPDAVLQIDQALSGLPGRVDGQTPVFVIPEDPLLVAPTVSAVIDAVDGELVFGDPALCEREALGIVVAGMSMEHMLPRLIEGAVVVVPGDRAEVLLAVLAANESGAFASSAAVVLNGGFALDESVKRLIDAMHPTMPIISTVYGTYETTVRINRAQNRLAGESKRKEERAIALFDRNVNHIALFDALDVEASPVVTPLMFEYGLAERARSVTKHIVLPEGGEDRILRAAAIVLARGIADLTILGDEQSVRARARSLGLHLDQARVVSTSDPTLHRLFGEKYAELRAKKGVTLDQALDIVTDVAYFGTMMVYFGMADGMVSGAVHTTAHTLRPAFEIIKTKPGVSIASSVFLMALADRVLVYGDCAVVPDPTAEQLADIAISAAATAQQFGIEPRVAMLSYSTGDSGRGADVDKVKAATELVHERAPELLVDGPLQYDAAADAVTAAAKAPGSRVAGRATVFIFPDLNTGNNTYKAVQRSAGAVAIGPVLQGLKKPVNDLSRGALVEDIVNTIAITAIQAQSTE